MDTAETMLDAAEAFVALVSEIPQDAWERQALGVWDVRALVGHTARAMSTALDYLNKPPRRSSWSRPRSTSPRGTVWIGRSTRRWRRAGSRRAMTWGRAAEVIETMTGRLRAAISATSGDPVIHTLVGGMRLSDYLETRTVELVVHASDLSIAVGRAPHLPPAAVHRVLHIICDAAMLNDRGLAAIRQLSARDGSAFELL